MIRKSAPVLLATVLTLGAAPAALANQWHVQTGGHGQRARIPAGQSVEIPTEGEWKLKVRLAGEHNARADCAARGRELLSNPTTTEAFATMTSMTLSCDSEVTATPVLMPWSGELGSDCQPCLITRPMAFDLVIAGVDYGVFSGAVTGKIGDFDNPVHDELDHGFQWYGERGGVMTNEEGGTLALSGKEAYGEPGHYACGENNEAKNHEEEGIAERRRREARERAGLTGDGDGD